MRPLKQSFYNESNRYCVAWLNNLIDTDWICHGRVYKMSIEDVDAKEVKKFNQAHFFAGIGGWSYALRLAKWPDSRPVWTGSPPYEPFNAKDAKKWKEHPLNFWDSWFRLIAECKPPVIFIETSIKAIQNSWYDVISNDLENIDYAVGAAVLPACGVGAPQIGRRLWVVAESNEEQRTRRGGKSSILASPDSERLEERNQESLSETSIKEHVGQSSTFGFWERTRWLECDDGRIRATEPGLCPLVDGVSRRMDKIIAYGSSLVPYVAKEFIETYLQTTR